MESLGKKLKSAREEQGLSYSDVSQETNIASRYLSALEQEDFSKFPGEAYALGFLKSYSEYLGLDHNELFSLYRSLKLAEQPVPVEQLLREPPVAPKIIRGLAAAVLVLALAGGIYFFVSRFSAQRVNSIIPYRAIRMPVEYVMNASFLERRFYPGDSILVTEGASAYTVLFSNLTDAVTLTTPRGPVVLDLGQEVTLELDNYGFHILRVIAADFVRNDSNSGALLRFEQEFAPPLLIETPTAAPIEIFRTGREAAMELFSAPNAFPFTLQVQFQGLCFFRYEVLFERDRPGRTERYFQRLDEINIFALNGIRLGISNARAVRMQVLGGGRVVPFEVGGPGEIVAGDLRWIRDIDNRYSLVFIRLD